MPQNSGEGRCTLHAVSLIKVNLFFAICYPQHLLDGCNKRSSQEDTIRATTCKELAYYQSHLYFKKKLEDLKVNDFSSTHHRTEVMVKTITPKSGETDKFKESQPRHAYLKKKSLQPESGAAADAAKLLQSCPTLCDLFPDCNRIL